MTTRYRVEHNLPKTPKDEIGLIRKEERERAIDEIEKIISPVLDYCSDYFDSESEMGVNLAVLKHNLKEFRKGGE